MFTSKQRAYLRSLAATQDTIFQIGKGGITEEITKQVGNALEARELIKLRVLENAEYKPAEAAEILAQALGAEVVTVIGSKFVLFRVSSDPKKRKIDPYAVR